MNTTSIAVSTSPKAEPEVSTVLKKKKPFRQIEAAEMMVAANKFTAT